MMRRVNLHEAKTHLSRLVAQALAGEGFVICKAGVPLVQVTRLADPDSPTTPLKRRLGLLAGQCSLPDDFDQIASDEIADLFEGLPCGMCWRIPNTRSVSAWPPSGSW
jgi:antitoxin (DNA-binding transcriptional repressor) of toxin-antitoxin stability system